ncbi:MAG: hypothetical protein ABIG45_04980 [Bacillota bacterium]
MKMEKFLALVLSVALVVSAAVFATAESAETAAQETVTAEDATAVPAEVYTLDEMLSAAMADAYARQASYAVYAEAFPDSKSIAAVDVHPQIVLLEMLLKAHGLALPAATADVTAPATAEEAYQAIAEAESNAAALMKSYLAQEALTEDAQMIFRSVLSGSRQNAAAFTRRIRAAKRAEELTELLSGDNVQKFVVEGKPGRDNGGWTVYVISNNPTDEQADDTTDMTDTTETTEATTP